MARDIRPIRTFPVSPYLPARLEGIRELAYNLIWSWDTDAQDLFRRMDPDLWRSTDHNPVLILGSIQQDRLDALSRDAGFLAHYDRVRSRLAEYIADRTRWYQRSHPQHTDPVIAYFSAEYGLSECLTIYSGGMGVLSGDHLKSASDLGMPLVGVGLLYQQGYLRQRLNNDGWQQELLRDNDFYNLPITLERRPDGQPVTIQVEYPGRLVTAQVWRVQVGRIRLFLLDTNVPANDRVDQDITDQLYGGDRDMRIRQEILLGIGGIRALRTLGINPVICHMNEGHSAFLALERTRLLMAEHHVSFEEASLVAAAGNVFTTHTPVPAGNDYFAPDLIERYFAEYYPKLGLSSNEFMALGRIYATDLQEHFCMTVLALRLAANRNGVSKLHEVVSREMWAAIWPETPIDDVPITSITNGIHTRSWLSHDFHDLFDRYLGPRWIEDPTDYRTWQALDEAPPEEIWRRHERRRERLVAVARRLLREQLTRRGAPAAEVAAGEEALNPEALTIGFARRFASYKRALLLFRDEERLARLLNDPARPVQIILAGKAHPQDSAGKDLIRQIVHLARKEQFRRHIVFVEDYDLTLARYMVQGSDVWLNNPIRPLEASGTSGMKAAANGVLNCSVLDGWWDEAYTPDLGWAIGRGENYDDPNYQDEVESRALYDLLEHEVVPTFYDRGRENLPRRWIARMKAAITTIAPFYNTHRMVSEYANRFYVPSIDRYRQLSQDGLARGRVLAAWLRRVRQQWGQLHITGVELDTGASTFVGKNLRARVTIQLGELTPEDVTVQLYLGGVDSESRIVDAETTTLQFVERTAAGASVFGADSITCARSGMHGYTVRVLPWHQDLSEQVIPGLVVWA